MFVEDGRWLHEVVGKKFFLPLITRSYSLASLHYLLVARHLEWELARPSQGATIGQIGHAKSLLLGHIQDGYPKREASRPAELFTNQYLRVEGEYSFRYQVDGRIAFSDDKLWSDGGARLLPFSRPSREDRPSFCRVGRQIWSSS